MVTYRGLRNWIVRFMIFIHILSLASQQTPLNSTLPATPAVPCLRRGCRKAGRWEAGDSAIRTAGRVTVLGPAAGSVGNNVSLPGFDTG